MVNFFVYLYSIIKKKDSFSERRFRYYNWSWRLVVRLANIVLPVYFKLTTNNKRYRLSSSGHKKRVIVSLTSFSSRINRVWIVIECILRQTVLPDKIILWLSKEEFKDYHTLPKDLLELRKRGLEIVLCDGDLRSHKKYYYAVKRFLYDIIITVDDDIFYHSTLIESLLAAHKEFPDTVCFNRGRKIKNESNTLLPYRSWELLQEKTGPAYHILQIGVGGVLYPSGVLAKEVLNKEIFLKHCSLADDIWLYAMVQLNDKQLVKTNFDYEFLPIIIENNRRLFSINMGKNKNDEQIKAVREYYVQKWNKDPFQKVFNDER